MGKDILPAKQEALRAQAHRAINEQVIPALRWLRDFVAGEQIAAAPSSGALGSHPGGAEVYAAQAQSNTTTDLSLAQFHTIGQREMARLRAEMEAVMKEVKFEGSFAALVQNLNSAPKFFYTSPEALLAGYRDIANSIDPELPKLFALPPCAPYGVRAMQAHSSTDRAEFYNGRRRTATAPAGSMPKRRRTRNARSGPWSPS